METNTNVAQNLMPLAFAMLNLSIDRKEVKFNEVVDFGEPVARTLPRRELAFHFLFNTQPVKTAARLFAYAIEQQAKVTPALWAKANKLTVERELSPSKITNYFDFVSTLTPEELEFCIEQSDAYNKRWNHGITALNFLLNDGSWKPGDIVTVSGLQLGCQLAIIAHTEKGSPIILLIGKEGKRYQLDFALSKDVIELVAPEELPEEDVKELKDALKSLSDDQLDQKIKWDDKRKKRAESADKKAKKDAEALEKKVDKATKYIIEKQGDAGKEWIAKFTEELETADPEKKEEILNTLFDKEKDVRAAAKKAGKKDKEEGETTTDASAPATDAKPETISAEEAVELTQLHKQICKQLKPAKYKDASKDDQKYANALLEEADRLKAANDLTGLQEMAEEVTDLETRVSGK